MSSHRPSSPSSSPSPEKAKCCSTNGVTGTDAVPGGRGRGTAPSRPLNMLVLGRGPGALAPWGLPLPLLRAPSPLPALPAAPGFALPTVAVVDAHKGEPRPQSAEGPAVGTKGDRGAGGTGAGDGARGDCTGEGDAVGDGAGDGEARAEGGAEAASVAPSPASPSSRPASGSTLHPSSSPGPTAQPSWAPTSPWAPEL